jgi:hypothetical protein
MDLNELKKYKIVSVRDTELHQVVDGPCELANMHSHY